MATKKKKAARPAPAQDTGMKRRLADQLANFKKALKLKAKVAKLNVSARDLQEVAFYPVHDKRRETPAYKKVHHDLVVAKDLPCLVCGVKNSTLKKRADNPYGAAQLETHHHVIEWALANAIDAGKFNKILRPHLAHRHPAEAMYGRTMTGAEIEAWVDHSPDNLWVLCDVHHRAVYYGIHAITYPIWCPQDLLKPDFERFVRGALRGGAAARAKKR